MKKLIMVVFVLFCVMEYSLANYHENQNEIRCEEILSAGMPCPECGGAGKFHRQVACNACNGGGYYMESVPCGACSNGLIYDAASKGMVSCQRCKGTGYVDERRSCGYCHGSGKRVEQVVCDICKGKGIVFE